MKVPHLKVGLLCISLNALSTESLPSCNSTGNYSCLAAEFHLHRSIGFHLIQSYLPSTLIVGISWVSFWMDVDCVPARVTLGVITLLSISGQVANGEWAKAPIFNQGNLRNTEWGIYCLIDVMQ